MYRKLFSALPKSNFVAYLLKMPSIECDLSQIYRHAFNQQLFDGTLCPAAFGKYLHDDYVYLHYYANVLKKLAFRIKPSNRLLAKQLMDLSTGIISSEQQMQRKYEKYFKHTPGSKTGPAISKYITFLKTNATHEKVPVALCSILPCFLIYAELGKKPLYPNQLLHNPYKRWIETYSSAKFIAATNELTKEINKLAAPLTVVTKTQMKDAFQTGVCCELDFFNEAHPIHCSSFSSQSL